MKIGLDISQIVYQGTGVARFTAGLVNTILDNDKKNQWLFFFSGLRQKLNPELKKRIIKCNHELIEWSIPPTLLCILWNNLHNLAKRLTLNVERLNNLDWFITSDWTEPPLSKTNKTTIVHDLTYLRYPQTVHNKIRTVQTKRLKLVKKESRIIFADSQSTKDDLVSSLNIGEKKIVVNYPGVDVQKPSSEEIKKTLLKYKLTKPFILSVGKLEPRKNLKRLIEAYSKSSVDNVELVIVGPQGWNNETIEQYSNIAIKGMNVKFLGYVSDMDLYALYASCLFFIYPSIWEGFGYPVIEAMKLGAPVTTSNSSSLKEIAGDAALLFDPLNIDSIIKSIQTMTGDKKLRENMVLKGTKQSAKFTWKNYYDKLLSILSFNNKV